MVRVTRRHIRIGFLLGCVALFACAIWDMHLQYNGVCLELGRPLTDDEKIRAVIEDMNRYETHPVEELIQRGDGDNYETFTGYVPRKKIPFASVDEFLKENPNCCAVEIHDTYGSPPAEGSWGFSKAMGAYAGHVTVNFKLHYIDANGAKRKTQSSFEATIQNCGAVN